VSVSAEVAAGARVVLVRTGIVRFGLYILLRV
jgi:hypothetical protein